MTDVTHYVYISTGKLAAMFTLWTGRECFGETHIAVDHYVCNLAGAGNEEEAERKAIDYAERMSERMGVKVHFDGFRDFASVKRRNGLSAADTAKLNTIEAGRFPFGKHAGQLIADAPDSYILFFADKHGADDLVTKALAAACMGVALERDLIAKREAARQERAEADAKSEYVGQIGERLTFEGELLSVFFKDDGYGQGFHINKLRTVDGNLVVYFGNSLGAKGERIKFKGTVKAHCEYQGVKSTKINRPSKLEY